MQRAIETSLTDGELLSMYSAERDQRAFQELRDRYHSMVLRVCRRVLADCQEADDAAQQVFVALSMKAGLLNERESIASWLYRAAWNISNRTRRSQCIRKMHENSAGTTAARTASADGPEPDTREFLQEALAEIPSIYSEAIVLHYFCGYTIAESAARLRCPAGTVAARVSRGVERLRARLGDRKLILTAVGIKLLLLGMAGGSKASAAALATKGGPPAGTAGYTRVSRGRLYRAARKIGLWPAVFGYPVMARATVFGSVASGATVAAARNLLRTTFPTFWKFFLVEVRWKQIASVLAIALLCAGAGAAATGNLVLPRWALMLKSSADDSPAQQANAKNAKPASQDAQESKKDDAAQPVFSGAGSGTPVPEPSTLTVLIGAAALSLCRRGRRKRIGAAYQHN